MVAAGFSDTVRLTAYACLQSLCCFKITLSWLQLQIKQTYIESDISLLLIYISARKKIRLKMFNCSIIGFIMNITC